MSTVAKKVVKDVYRDGGQCEALGIHIEAVVKMSIKISNRKRLHREWLRTRNC